ncbi:MAG: 5-formyltetrahydrofolate cyclo-ligase [Butyricimonas faecihominis]
MALIATGIVWDECGYYDKILKETRVARKVGICFGFQFVEEVPVDELDVRMDLVIHGI